MNEGKLLQGASSDIICSHLSSGNWADTPTKVPQEMALTIYVDTLEVVTILCTPTKLNCLVLGFLYSEGIISGMSDVASMRVCEDDSLADVRLSKPGFKLPGKRTLTSGCGGGVSFAEGKQKVKSGMSIAAKEVMALMKQLNEKAELYKTCGGVHTSGLGDKNSLLMIAEDIGRHNTIDKIIGECQLTKLSTKDKVLLTSGRITSEMLSKATMMETPVVVSRSSPTDRSIALAQKAGITLIGYVRSDRLSIYSHSERVTAS